jgi:hypothetical protein
MKINQLVNESQMTCSECGGPSFSDLILAEKQDACYNKVRSRYKVWPSAYASGALVQCRKKGAANWGNKSEGVAEGAPIVVMPRSDRFGTKKPAQPQRYMGDIVPPTKPPSTEKRGVKGRPGQRPMPDQGVAEGSEWETRHDEFTTVGDRATPEQINKIVSALGVAAKQASGKRGFLNKIVGKQSNGDLARMAHSAETLAKNIQRNSNAKPGTDERKELGQHLVYAVSLLKRIKGEKGVAEGKVGADPYDRGYHDGQRMGSNSYHNPYSRSDEPTEWDEYKSGFNMAQIELQNDLEDNGFSEGVAEGVADQVNEISADPAYLRAAERSLGQARDTQRQYWKSPEEKAAARRTELKREKGMAGYGKRHRAANPEMYPKVKAQPAPKLRDPSTEYSDDYSVWAAGRRDTMEQSVAEGQSTNDNSIWGPQGRFAGDTRVDISSAVTKTIPKVGQRVKVQDGRIQGLGEIMQIKGDRATVWIHSYARSFEVPLSAISFDKIKESKSTIAGAIASVKL